MSPNKRRPPRPARPGPDDIAGASLVVSWGGWVGLRGLGVVGLGVIMPVGCGGLPRVAVVVAGFRFPEGVFLVVGGRWQW